MAKRQKVSISREWPAVATAADLPNVSGAATQSADLEVGDTCYVTGTGASYTCTTATQNAGVWVLSSLITNGVTSAMLRQSAGLSVVGRSANSTGDVADITAATDLDFLRRNGTSIGFGTHPTVEQLKLGVPASTTQTIASGTSATISAAVRTVLLATGSGNFNLTMRTLNDGDEILLVKTSTDANTITLVRAGSETINGAASNLLIPGSASTAGYVAWTIRVVSGTAVVVV